MWILGGPGTSQTAFPSCQEEVEVVECKYLSVHLDNRLDWRRNTDAVDKKEQSRLYVWRTFSPFRGPSVFQPDVQSDLLEEQHQSQSLKDTDQTDEEGWVCSGDCSDCSFIEVCVGCFCMLTADASHSSRRLQSVTR